MGKSSLFMTSCAFTLLGLTEAFAVLPTPAYVDTIAGNNTNAGIGCPVNLPCADLNTALSVISDGGQVIISKGGVFGPVVLTSGVTITGTEPNTDTNIVADPTAMVGCVGNLPGACGQTNHGYAVEVAVPADDGVSISHVVMSAGISGGAGALKLTTGNSLDLAYDIFRGRGDTATGPVVALYPNNSGTSSVLVSIAHSDIGYNGSGPAAGAIEVKPGGSTSLALYVNHVVVHHASYGIRTDGSLVTAGTLVSTAISETDFFGLTVAAVNAFSTMGTGTVEATFDTTRILNTGTGLKANGPLSSVVITNNTVTANTIGVQQQNGATIFTSGTNTIKNNGTNVSGTLTPSSTM
ncbi:MAG TPA: hypothetical protein VIJ78_13715 [Pseudolabrys sp.]